MYSVKRPSIRTCASSNRACPPKTLPVRCWQARQWQIDTRTGSPSTTSRSCPQLHEASRCTQRSYCARARELRLTSGDGASTAAPGSFVRHGDDRADAPTFDHVGERNRPASRGRLTGLLFVSAGSVIGSGSPPEVVVGQDQ